MSREEQQEIQVIGPGQILKSARLSANLSVQDIALKTHLKSIVIEDIEADKYDSNISLTFIKGYIKLYAKQVMVPESEVMEAFASINIQKKEPAKLQSFSRRVANQANDDKLMLMTYFILAVVIALVVIWWFQQGENENIGAVPDLPETGYAQGSADGSVEQAIAAIDIVEQPANQAGHSNSEEVTIADDSDPKQVSTELESDALITSLNNITQSDLASQISPSEEPQQVRIEDAQSEVVDTVELVFEFSADCWMNLTDATGENIAYGVKKLGRVMTVSGLPPFVVTLGAPQAVQISYAGEEIDMSVFKPGNTAKFTLPFVD